MRLTRGRRLAGLLLALLAAYSLRVLVARPAVLSGPAPRDGYTRVGGVVHVHTTMSDGGGTPEEVIAAAREAGLGFVALTDHNNLDAKDQEGYRDGVLVMVGSEISTQAGHILGLGIPDPGFRFSGDGHDALADVRDLGGFAFAAHSHSLRKDFRFTGWDLPGPWGIELLNGDSQWRAAGWGRLARTVALYPLNKRFALLGSLTPDADALARWDALLAERDVAGLGGADAHNRVPLGKRFAPRFPSYASVFSLLRTYAVLDAPLTGVAQRDLAAVAQALGRGHSYVGLDGLAPAGEISFVARRAGTRATMGDTVAPAMDLQVTLSGRMPEGARARILRDGREVAAGDGGATVAGAAEGVYRAEVHLRGESLPWVLTNPVYVFGPERAAARAARGGWPVPGPVAEARRLIESFEAPTPFVVAADTASTIDRNFVIPGEGVGGGRGARLRFQIGQPTEAHPDVYVALNHAGPRDFTSYQGLLFSIRADGVYRVWMQVRDENPASKDEGTEWWFVSVKTSRDWQRTEVPFARFRSINPATDGRLDLDKVRGLVFVIDKGALPPGAQGTIWIDDLALY